MTVLRFELLHQKAVNEGVKFLLENGADVNGRCNPHGNALCAASSEGHERIVRLLLEKGADINAPGGFYGNALYVTASDAMDRMVRRILENGASVKAHGGEPKFFHRLL